MLCHALSTLHCTEIIGADETIGMRRTKLRQFVINALCIQHLIRVALIGAAIV